MRTITDDAFDEIGVAITVFRREVARWDPSGCFRMVDEFNMQLP